MGCPSCVARPLLGTGRKFAFRFRAFSCVACRAGEGVINEGLILPVVICLFHAYEANSAFCLARSYRAEQLLHSEVVRGPIRGVPFTRRYALSSQGVVSVARRSFTGLWSQWVHTHALAGSALFDVMLVACVHPCRVCASRPTRVAASWAFLGLSGFARWPLAGSALLRSCSSRVAAPWASLASVVFARRRPCWVCALALLVRARCASPRRGPLAPVGFVRKPCLVCALRSCTSCVAVSWAFAAPMLRAHSFTGFVDLL